MNFRSAHRHNKNITNLGRDEPAGFRLDTKATHKFHATLSVDETGEPDYNTDNILKTVVKIN